MPAVRDADPSGAVHEPLVLLLSALPAPCARHDRRATLSRVDVTFSGEIFYWRGPSPFHFVATPDAVTEQIATVAPKASYGWGMIPATVHVGSTTWTTALWPKDGGYIVPLRLDVRRAEGLGVGDVVGIRLTVDT